MRKLLSIMAFSLLLILMACDISINGNNDVVIPPGGDYDGDEVEIYTPYPQNLNYEEFLCGATYELPSAHFAIFSELRKAKTEAHLNTITVYGLENTSNSVKDALFSALDDLDMKIAVRIEGYDSDFAFSFSDAKKVVDSYKDLIEYTSAPERRNQVAYFALNMPVDDGNVQENAGGLNSEAWIDAQVEYAEELVRLMRNEMAKYGADIPLYLSVFYGWQNDFNIPSYRRAGADGYFMNNYSYPLRGYNFNDWASSKYEELPDSSWTHQDLINADRLSISMNTFIKQYENEDGSIPPLVMEWGIHTAEYNNKKPTQQSAGLVKDMVAKREALSATYEFYREKYDFVQGFQYFGYNLYKREGSENAVMDWCLKYTD